MTFDPLTPTFQEWPKMPRLNRDIVITEKIDGTNAAVGILDDGTVYAQSRKKIITADSDNAGFARWVEENEDTLREGLGFGLHFGEWWGRGVQRGYGMDSKRFSLFNTSRWGDVFARHDGDGYADVEVVNDLHDAGVRVVPSLYEGPFNEAHIKYALEELEASGSFAAPGYMNPEGIVIFHTAANHCFKVTIKDDEKPKGSTE